MSLFRQNDKERFEKGFKSSVKDEGMRGCHQQPCEGKAKKQKKSELAPHNVATETAPKGHHLLQGLHFRADNDF